MRSCIIEKGEFAKTSYDEYNAKYFSCWLKGPTRAPYRAANKRQGPSGLHDPYLAVQVPALSNCVFRVAASSGSILFSVPQAQGTEDGPRDDEPCDYHQKSSQNATLKRHFSDVSAEIDAKNCIEIRAEPVELLKSSASRQTYQVFSGYV